MMTYLFAAPLTFILLATESLVWRWINVILFFGLLFFLLRKPVSAFFAERLARIRSSIERAAKEKAEAQERIKAIDARLAQLDSETAKIKEDARLEAAAEAERIKAQTEAEIAKMRETAQREIEAAKQNALVELRQYTANQAVSMAEQIIRRELNATDDAALLQRASSELKM